MGVLLENTSQKRELSEKAKEFCVAFNNIDFYYDYSDDFRVAQRGRAYDSKVSQMFTSLKDEDKRTVCVELSKHLNRCSCKTVKLMLEFFTDSIKRTTI